ncbi:Carboxylesterase 5A [Mortierella alpina]|nr:Carboxylesterase 5A [Mortierella alpina]
MGGSVGSMSISHLVLIPACHGLFHRAILQSGAASSLPTMRPDFEGQRYFDYLCQIFKVPADLPPLEKVALLRAVPEKTMAEIMNSTDIKLFSPTLDGVLFNEDSRLTIGDASLYDPNLNWVVIGACANEGSIFPASFNASTPQNVAKLKARLCAPGDDPVFDRIFGVPKTDAEATEISARLLGNGLFNFPILQASEALLVHPTCRLTRYHFDVQVQRTNELLPGLKAHHASELYFTLGNKALLAMLAEEERLFVRKVQDVWIEFVTAKFPEESHLPKVSNVLPTSTSEEVIVFGADLKVRRGTVERMSAEEVEFWRRSFAYAAQQAQLGRGVDVGFDTFKAS